MSDPKWSKYTSTDEACEDHHIEDAPDDTRERLARAGTIGFGCIGDWSEFGEVDRQGWYDAVDAILREMLEPSEGMTAAQEAAWLDGSNYRQSFCAAIQHILDGKADD